MSSSEISIADPGKEIRYFVIVRSSGCVFRNGELDGILRRDRFGARI
jgi:hypothetical protein